ncbi:MFS multidrug transporter-like protein [Bisporella sp. PMI_857]|nr:MFS multidrug transporter-like protein [Bisporella sp. PMI_857]
MDTEKAAKEAADAALPHGRFNPHDWSPTTIYDAGLNPATWSKGKRWYAVLAAAFVSFTGSLGSSIYSPAFGHITREFNVSSTVAILPLSLYVLALGMGPIIGAPASETYGRRPVYLACAPLGGLFALGAGFSKNIWTLCILRFFSGLSFAPTLAIGAGTIADVFPPEDRGPPSTIYILMPFLGPALGPVIGSFATERVSWEWTQFILTFFAVASLLLLCFTEETYKKIIIARRNRKRVGHPPPPSPFPNRMEKVKFMMTVTFVRPLHMLLTEPIVFCLSGYVAFIFAVLFGFFAAIPYTFKIVYNFSNEECGLVFLSVGLGCLLAVPTMLVCDRLFYQPQVRRSRKDGNNGIVPPEYRLIPAMIGSFGPPVGLFWFAWTARNDILWASPVVSLIPFAWGNLCIFIGSATYLVDTYLALNAASAIAANGFFRYTLGAAFPLFTLQMYHSLSIRWATSLLGFVSIGLLIVPWVIFKWGEVIRGRSSYETLKI